jgi:mono/diheme cytochrome c family protein
MALMDRFQFLTSAALLLVSCAVAAADHEAASRPSSTPEASAAAARSDYILYCAGCHGFDGAPVRLGRIPGLRDSMADFLKVDGGRAYLVQVPGVNNTGLSSARIARVMNWSLTEFTAPASLSGFVPYSEAEVVRYRASRPVDITRARRELIEKLGSLGIAKE